MPFLHAAQGEIFECLQMLLAHRASRSLSGCDVIARFFLGGEADVCAILGGFVFDTATAFIAWEIMMSIDWMAVTQEPVAQLLHFFMGASTGSVFVTKSATRSVQDGKESYLTQTLHLSVPYLRTPLSWASVRRPVAEYMHRTYQQPLHSSFLNGPIFRRGSHVSPEIRVHS